MQRTSASQIAFLWRVIGGFSRGILKHIGRYSMLYGALAKLLSIAVLSAAFIFYGLFAFPVPWKVTDPADPRFNPAHFRFSDYQNSNELSYALPLIIPLGTPKEEVDEILGHFGVRIFPVDYIRTSGTGTRKYKYVYRNSRSWFMETITMYPKGEHSWSIVLTYDDDGKLLKLF